MSHEVDILKLASLSFVLRLDFSIHDQMSGLVERLSAFFFVKMLSTID